MCAGAGLSLTILANLFQSPEGIYLINNTNFNNNITIMSTSFIGSNRYSNIMY